MRSYFKLPELMAIAKGMLAFVKHPKQSDYEHVILKLEDMIKCINQIPAICPKLNDKLICLFLGCLSGVHNQWFMGQIQFTNVFCLAIGAN